MFNTRLINRNVVTATGRTSMRLEPELWNALLEIATRERSHVSNLILSIESKMTSGGRTSAVRVFIVQYLRRALQEAEVKPNGNTPP